MVIGFRITIQDNMNSVIKAMQDAIFSWIPKEKDAKAIYINGHAGLDISKFLKDEKYDFIFAKQIFEYSRSPVEDLKELKMHLTKCGTLYIGAENRLGLKYFCGDIDPATKKSFAGIENYSGINNTSSWLLKRTYACNELKQFLNEADMSSSIFYSVLPSIEAAQLIYSENYTPEESLATRYIPIYQDPSRIFMREEWVYDSIIANGMFHKTANAYLIEYRADGKYEGVLHVTLTADRGEEFACSTIIKEEMVIKKAMYDKGTNRLEKMMQNNAELSLNGVMMVDCCFVNGCCIMPRIKAPILEIVMREAFLKDIDLFLSLFDRYRDVIYCSSEVVDVDERGPILKKCYVDLVPLNCFYVEDKFLFYDQEFYLENEPANLILWRATAIIYDGNTTMMNMLPISKLWDRYGITNYTDEYDEKTNNFLRKLRKQEELTEYNKKYLRNTKRIMENQQKMEKVLVDFGLEKEKAKESCFDELENKEIFLFGAGRYADEFISMYRFDYKICGIVDNDSSKYGECMYGLGIYSPNILMGRNPETYKVIVCIKNCESVIAQLHSIGTRYIGVFDISYVYPGRQKYLPGSNGLAPFQKFYTSQKTEIIEDSLKNTNKSPKKYHVGYIAGVFDLYHLGHLNMFRRAKERCDYLIVGVVSDEGVRINKKKEPFIPFEERIEIVRSCRYVDEAVEIPFVYCRTPEAFRKYHFDVQFSGSDYENDPGWLYMKDYLEKNGSTMEFFPYTEQTSSTKIKALIDKYLM